MIRYLCVFFSLLSTTASAADPVASPPKKPKLIIAIAVNQFRYDYLSKFRDGYSAGLKRLLERGATFDDAHHISYPTVTAVGHSTFLSGATPSQSGIVANEWFDRVAKETVTSVSDRGTKLIGGKEGSTGSSPNRLLVSTLGDELKMAGQDSHVISISIKDRSAILPGGHMADGAYWFDSASRKWVTSDYYTTALPDWVATANRLQKKIGMPGDLWMPLESKTQAAAKPFCGVAPAAPGVRVCGAIEATPWGNELIEDLAERALEGEKLGQHKGTDLLAVSFSSNDYVGHAYGPDDPAIRDISLRTDRLIGDLLDRADKAVGLGNVLVVLTADHGVGPAPEDNAKRRMPGVRIPDVDLRAAITNALIARYGEAKWLLDTPNLPGPFYLDTDLIASRKLTPGEVEETAAEAVRALKGVYRVLTRTQIMHGQVTRDPVSDMVVNGFFAPREPNLVVILEPFDLMNATPRASHGTPFNYDTHVPVIFMGNGIKPGHYYGRIAVNDIAPTLAAITGVLEPSGSVGRVLSEMFQ